jgi:phage shock protein E
MDSGRRLTGHAAPHRFSRRVGRCWAPLSALLVLVLTGLVQAENDLSLIRGLDSPLVIDVRSGSEFQSGAIDGAINLPVQGLPDTLIDTGVELDHEVIVYCRSGRRSAQAKTLLKAAGFTLVFDGGPMGQLEHTLKDSES